MCAEEGGEVAGGEAFFGEKAGELGGGCVDGGEEVVGGGGGGGRAVDEGADLGAAGAGYDGVVAGEDCGGLVGGWGVGGKEEGDLPMRSATLTEYLVERERM